MAPRGGGHGSGGGHSSSSGSSSSSSDSSSSSSSSSYGTSRGSSSRSSSVWGRNTSLAGSGFSESAITAVVAFTALFLATLIGIRIWAGRVKKQYYTTGIWKTVMGKRWGIAIWVGLFYYAWYFVEQILHEEQVTVKNIYYIFEFILLSTAFIAGIALLLTIFTLIYHMFLGTTSPNDSSAKLKKTIYQLHLGFIGLLSLIYIVYLALGIKSWIDRLQTYGSYRYAITLRRRGTPDYYRVEIAYQALYFVASVEILAAAVFLLVTKSKRGLSRSAVGFFLGLVAVPLLIQRVFALAFDAHFSLSYHYLTLEAFAAEEFITGAADMLVYAGVVATVAAIAKTQRTVPGGPATTVASNTQIQQPPMAQNGAPPQGQPQYYQPHYYPQQQQPQQYGYPPQPQQYGQEIKAFNAGSPQPQGFYPPPPQQNGVPNGAPHPGFVPQQPMYAPPPQQQYSPPPQQQGQYAPPPQQQYSSPPQQPGLIPQQSAQGTQQTSPVSSQSPQQPIAPQNQQGQALPSTHY